MDTVEYILKIILRLRDEASKKLAAVRSEVKGIGTDAKSSQAKLDGLNSSVSSLTRRLGGLQNRLTEIRTSIRQLGDDDDFDHLAESVGKAVDKLNTLTELRNRGGGIIRIVGGGDEEEQPGDRQRQVLTKLRQLEANRERRQEEESQRQTEILNAQRRRFNKTAVNIDDYFKVVEAVSDKGKNAGKRVFQVIDAATEEVVGERRKLLGARKLQGEAFSGVREKQFQNFQIREAEEAAQVESTETIKKETTARKRSTSKKQQEEVSVDDTVAAAAEEAGSRRRVARKKEKEASTVTPETRTDTENVRRAVSDAGSSIRKGAEHLRFHVEQVGERFQIIDSESNTVFRRGFKSFENAIDKLSDLGILFEKLDPDAGQELTDEIKGLAIRVREGRNTFEVFNEETGNVIRRYKTYERASDAASEMMDLRTTTEEDLIAALRSGNRRTKRDPAVVLLERLDKEEAEVKQAEIDSTRRVIEVNDRVAANSDKLTVEQTKFRDSLAEVVVDLKVSMDELGRSVARITTEAEEIDAQGRISRTRHTIGPRGQEIERPVSLTIDPALVRPPVGGGAQFAGGNEDRLARQEKRVKALTNTYDTLVESLNLVRRQFREGALDEEQFFFQTDRIRKAIADLARSAPVDFGEDIGVKFFNAARRIKDEIEQLRQIGENNDLGEVARAFDKIKRSVDNVTDGIDLSRGAMTILRREGEQMRGLGLSGLTEEMTRSQRELFLLQRDLEEREREGRATTTVERTIQRVASRIQAQREILRQLLETASNDDTPIKQLTASEEDVDTSGIDVWEEKMEGLAEQYDSLIERQHKFAREGIGPRDREITVLIEGLKRLANEYNNLSRAYNVNSGEFRFTQRERARLVEQANFLIDTQKRETAELAAVEKLELAAQKQSIHEQANAARQRDEAVAGLARLRLAYESLNDEIGKTGVSSDRVIDEFKQISSQARTLGGRIGEIGSPERQDADDLRRSSAAAALAVQKSIDVAQSLVDQRDAAETLLEAYGRLRQAFDANDIDLSQARAEFKRYQTDLAAMARGFDRNSDEARTFGILAQDAGDKGRRATQDYNDQLALTGGFIGRIIGRLNNFGLTITRLGENVSKIDNQLRGLAVLALIIFVQQLLTAVTGLAGGLFAVGSSAAFAAAGLGSTLVAGIAQAIPAVLLLTAALASVKEVTDALTQAELVRQQGFQRASADRQKSAQEGVQDQQRRSAMEGAANRLANAEEALADARDRVGETEQRLRDSQEALTQAREDAEANLQKLIDAELDAQLAARGAVLDQAEAQDRLSEALAGGTSIDLQRAENELVSANLGVPRARRAATQATQDLVAGQDIESTEGVVAARRQVTEARKAIDDANDGVTKAKRSLDDAGRAATLASARATTATADTFAAGDKLLFLLQQLSPAQLRLFVSLQRIKQDYKDLFTPITDILVDSFSRGVDTADRILKNPGFLNSARNLATQLAGAFDGFRTAIFEDPRRLERMFDIIDDGAANIMPLEGIAEDLADIFLNIAESGGKSLPRVIDWVGDLVEDIRRLTDNTGELDDFFSAGTDHAIGWADLVKNTVILFATLAGAGAATEGLTLIEQLNDAVERATGWVRGHRAEVGRFFSDSADVVRVIAGLVAVLGSALLQVFDPGKLERFVTFIEDIIVPALVNLTKMVGGMVDIFLSFTELPIIGDILSFFTRWGLVMVVLASIITSITGALALFVLQTTHLAQLISRVGTGFGVLNGGIGKFIGLLAQMAGKSALLAPLAAVLGKIAGSFTGRGTQRASGSIVDDILNLGTGPSRTTTGPGGAKTTVRPAPRRGILGRLGLGKVVAESADDAVKAADDVAVKSAEKFGGKFLGTAGRLLKGFGWTAVGFAAAEGVIAGVKTGNIESAVRDFASSLSLGLIDSSKEKAHEAAEAIRKEFAEPGDIPTSRQITRLGIPTANEIRQQSGIGGSVRDRAARPINPADYTNNRNRQQAVLDAKAQESSAGRWLKLVEEIRKRSPEAAKALEKLPSMTTQLGIGRRGNETNTFFENLKEQAELLRKKFGKEFPELNAIVDGFEKNVDESMRKVQARLKPQAISIDLTFDLARLDWDEIKPKDWKENWKGLVDDSIGEMKKLKPGARTQARDAIFAMVDQMVKNNRLPAGAAKDIKGYVTDEWEDMRKKSSRKARQTREAVTQNLAAAAITVETLLGNMGVNVNKILDAFGVGKVQIPKTPRSAGRTAGQIVGAVGELFGGGSRTGGIIGAATGFSGLAGKVGERGKDTLIAAIGRGEMVFNAFHQRYLQPAVEAYYGHPLQDVFKRIKGEHAGPPIPGYKLGGIPRFATGRESGASLFDGHPSNVSSALLRVLELLKQRFPEVTVTSTTDHSTRTSTGGISDHTTGSAVDISGSVQLMARIVRYINSSGLWKQLKQGIHNPGLAVNQGKRVSGPGFFQNAWPQHINHIHLAVGDAIRGAFRAASTRLRRQKFNFPVDGPVKELGQRILDRARKAGQRFIDRKLEASEQGGDSRQDQIPEGRGQRRIIRQAARIAGIPAKYLWGVYGAETNFGKNVATSGAGAQGPFQFMPGTADAYVPGGRANVNNFGAAAVGAARYLKYLYNIFKSWPEAIGHYNSGPGGNLTNPETAAYIPKVLSLAQSFRRGGIPQFADGGVIPGGDGTPVNIIGHAGEWMVNKVQQSRIAQMLGTNVEAVKSMLGFSGGPKYFAGGGEITPTINQEFTKIDAQTTSAAARERIRRIQQGIFALPLIPIRNWEEVLREANNASQAFANIAAKLAEATKNSTRRVLRSRFLNVINQITKEGGLLDKAAEARERMSQELSTGLTRLPFKIEQFRKGGRTQIRVVRRASVSDVDVADQALDNARKEIDAITGARGIAVETLNKVSARLRQLRRGGITKAEGAEVRGLTAQQNRLKDQVAGLNEELANGIQDVYDKQVARQQAVIDSINKRAETREAGFGIAERLANVFGDRGGLAKVADDRIASMTKQMGELRKRIAAAKRIGNTELVQQLQQQIADIDASIQETLRQKFEAAVEDIGRAAEQREAGLGIRQRLAELFGNTGALNNVVNDRVASIRTQVSSLGEALNQAKAAGYTDLAQQIQNQIDDLNTSVVELINGQMRAAMEQINNASSRRLGRLDLIGRMADAVGAVGLSGTGTVAGQTFSRQQIFQQRGEALGSQRSELQQLLHTVQTTPETAQNMQLIQDLTDQLAELDVTIAENTQAAFQARVQDVNAQASFGLNVLSLQQRIAELTGTMTNTDSAEQVRALLQQRNILLERQRLGLEQLLAEAQASGDQKAIEDLTTQLLENQIAVLENTQAINQIVNADTTQDFSSSAWQQFRTAIFDGLGNLLPHYAMAVPSAATGAKIMQGGIIRVHEGEEVVPAEIVRGTTMSGATTKQEINTEVHLSNPTEVADPVYIGNAIGFRIANNPNLRP